MRVYLIVSILPLALFAGVVSQWSPEFVLADHPVAVEKQRLLADFEIKASPNPFSPSVTFTFSGVKPGAHISIRIFDIGGKYISDISNLLLPGVPAFRWDASALPCGIYMAQIQAGVNLKCVRLALVR